LNFYFNIRWQVALNLLKLNNRRSRNATTNNTEWPRKIEHTTATSSVTKFSIMPLSTRTIAKGIPPRVRSPPRKASQKKKAASGKKRGRKSRKRHASDSDDDEDDSDVSQHKAKVTKRRRKDVEESDSTLEEIDDGEPPQAAVEDVDATPNEPSSDAEVSWN
jgi:hypothetical protein